MPRHISPGFPVTLQAEAELKTAPIQEPGEFDHWLLLPQKKYADVGSRAVESVYGNDIPIEGTVSIVGSEGFELTVVDELQTAIQSRRFTRVRHQFDELVEGIMADPFGPTCIDAFKDTDAGQWARLVHEVTGPLADLVPGKKLAIKGTGLQMDSARNYLELGGFYRTRLTNQFRQTLALSRLQQRKAPEGIAGVLFVNEVYGILSYRDETGSIREWMLMEYIEDAEAMVNIPLALSRGGIAFGFEADRYPELSKLGQQWDWEERDVLFYKDLAENVGRELGYHGKALDDLNGNNVLRQARPNGVRYTFIDVQSH